MVIIRLLGSSLQIQRVLRLFLTKQKQKSDDYIKLYSYFFVVIYY